MRASTRHLMVLAAAVFAGSAMGCGGSGSGTTTTTTTTQNQNPGTPAIASLSPASVSVGSPDTTLTVSGSNFVPGSEITWQGNAVATLYLSSTSLQTDLPASDLTTAGTYQVAVEDPTDVGGDKSSSVSFTISNQTSPNGVTFINLAANDLAWDPVNQVIYLSVPSVAGANGNSVQVLNPSTGILGTNVFAGSEPDLLAVSETSQYLYVALDGSSSLQRFKLPALTTDINISFGVAGFDGPYVAMDVEASPAADGTVAFVLGAPGYSPEEEGGVHIYDDSTPRANGLCGWIQSGCTGPGAGQLFDSIQWSPAADQMYMLNNEDTGFDYYAAPVTASGFGTVTDYGGLAGGFGDILHYDATTNLLYTDYGVVIDPSTGLKAGQISASGLAAADGKNGLIFYLGQTTANLGSSTYTIESFDINRLTPVSSINLPNVIGTPSQFIRWGTSGLAFTTVPGGVYLYTGSFVTTSARPARLPAENVRRTWSSQKLGRDRR